MRWSLDGVFLLAATGGLMTACASEERAPTAATPGILEVRIVAKGIE